MSEFGGLWKHENKQHALVPPKTEFGCPNGGGITNDHRRNAEEEEDRQIGINLCSTDPSIFCKPSGSVGLEERETKQTCFNGNNNYNKDNIDK